MLCGAGFVTWHLPVTRLLGDRGSRCPNAMPPTCKIHHSYAFLGDPFEHHQNAAEALHLAQVAAGLESLHRMAGASVRAPLDFLYSEALSSHIPKMAIVWYTLNTAQNGIGNY